MGKNPAFQFYPADWLMDSVSGCSLAAQGLWLRMMIVMHSAERRGYLVMNGRPMTDEFIASKCGADIAAYRALLTELSLAGIPRKTADGILYNKRMADDERKRRESNERLKRFRNADETQKKRLIEDEDEVEVQPVISTSKKQLKPELPEWLPLAQWNGFIEMRQRVRKPLTARGMQLILGKLEALRASGQDPGEVLDQSTENSWQGVFELRQVRNGTKQPNRAEERQQQGLDNIAKALRNRLSEVDGADPGAIHEYARNGATGNGMASGLAASRQRVRDEAVSGRTGSDLDKGEILSPSGRDSQRN